MHAQQGKRAVHSSAVHATRTFISLHVDMYIDQTD